MPSPLMPFYPHPFYALQPTESNSVVVFVTALAAVFEIEVAADLQFPAKDPLV